jgi:lipoprotein-anchoring transpeptidase ErfK/SrfK
MAFRTASAVTALFIGFATGPVAAQFAPPAPLLPPPFLPPAAVEEAPPPYDLTPDGRRLPPPATYRDQANGTDPSYEPPAGPYGRAPVIQAEPGYPPGGWREPPPLPGQEPVDPRAPVYGNQPTYGNAPPTYGNTAPTYGNNAPTYGNQPQYGDPPHVNQPQYGNNQPQYGNQPPYEDQRQQTGRTNQGLLPNPFDILRPPGSVGREQEAVVAALPPEDRPETGPRKELAPQFRRTMVDYRTREPAGTLIIDTPNTYLYLVLGNGKAMRYGIGVGREGFTWAGAERVSRMAEWPDWHPPAEMIERQPYLPRFMAGGEGNPLGARALYLGKTLYRIHGTNQPSTIGTFVSSGCIRLTNEDITDLYYRVQVGTRVVVLPGRPPTSASAAPVSHEPQGPYKPLAPPKAR